MSLTLADLSLFPATPNQTLESRKRSYPFWKADLTEEQYLARDTWTDSFEQAEGGKLITWYEKANTLQSVPLDNIANKTGC
jgi:hypothetical protein